jgi:hypothetical protein
MWAVSISLALATPYWTEQDFLKKQGQFPSLNAVERLSLQPREVDNYSLLFEYVQICDFLVSMQESNPSDPNYGGMHEGESAELWAIVETDNTQEAIRVWSTYALISGDSETYRDNIQAAWVYTMNYPAYDEEGTDSDYYRVHNCGWALVAESRYRQVYQDSSFLWYADSCAAYIETHRLPYTGYGGFYNSLHPLVEGWAAGALYDYGIEFNDSVAVNHALEVGSDVQDWITADPDRLNANEVWAMCGGTALWGVCRSVFAENPAAAETWLPGMLPYMDTYAGPGEWNNSWNVWYAYAYHASAAVLNDPTYSEYAFALVDTLLDADTDNDGGITATSTDPPTSDQSWVSCYLDYMGMETFILNYPDWDAAALDFLSPDTTLPIAQGEPVEIYVLVANTGLDVFGDVNADVSGAFSGSGSTYLDFADVDTLFLGSWMPLDSGWTELMLTVSPGGENVGNDTLVLPVNVLGWGEVSGSVCDALTGSPLGATLFFYRWGGSPDQPLFSAETNPETGIYSTEIIEGMYRVVVDPQIPYTDREADSVEVFPQNTTSLDFSLYPAPILLVDDDGGAAYDTCFSVPLADEGYDAYRWETAESGCPTNALGLFDAVIWLTGDQRDSALTSDEISALTGYLDTGGRLFLTGQNIAESIAGESFLSEYLGASFEGGTSNQQQVIGIEGDPVTAGMTLMFPGAGGAGNQNSTDMISAVGAGMPAMIYAAGSQPGAAVRIEGDYQSLFLAFGLEGVSGAASTTTRTEFLSALLDWFDVSPTGVKIETENPLPENLTTLILVPNPFNSTVNIHYRLSAPEKLNLDIYDVGGRLIEIVPMGTIPSGSHQMRYRFNSTVASGIYFFVIRSDKSVFAAKGVFLK